MIIALVVVALLLIIISEYLHHRLFVHEFPSFLMFLSFWSLLVQFINPLLTPPLPPPCLLKGADMFSPPFTAPCKNNLF